MPLPRRNQETGGSAPQHNGPITVMDKGLGRVCEWHRVFLLAANAT